MDKAYWQEVPDEVVLVVNVKVFVNPLKVIGDSLDFEV
jgi:hypothetical protein